MSMAHDPDDELLTIKEGGSHRPGARGNRSVLAVHRTGPRSIKVGRRVCYWKSDVLQWLEDLAS